MTKTTIIAALLAALVTQASAQQRTFYDAGGKVVGRLATDSQGAKTNYDCRGRVISREATTGNQTTIYDAGGRNVGKVSSNRWWARPGGRCGGTGRTQYKQLAVSW
jgi:YD repeat-containing protein